MQFSPARCVQFTAATDSCTSSTATCSIVPLRSWTWIGKLPAYRATNVKVTVPAGLIPIDFSYPCTWSSASRVELTIRLTVSPSWAPNTDSVFSGWPYDINKVYVSPRGAIVSWAPKED